MRKKLRIVLILCGAALAAALVYAWLAAAWVSLVGVEVPARVTLGEEFDLTLLVRPHRTPAGDYNLFIHFLRRGKEGGMINADVTLPPGLRKGDSSGILRLGPFRCAVPEGESSGEYVIEAGLYYEGKDIFGRRKLMRVPYRNRGWRDWNAGSFEARPRPPREYPPGAFSDGGYAVGIAGPLDKVFPEKRNYRDPLAPSVILSAARNETESFQIVVIPGESDLEGVRLEAEPLRERGGGAVIPAENITIRRVGYVTTKRPYYNVTRVGEWPDPLVPPGPGGCIVRAGRVQPFWVDVRVPSDAPPGAYAGSVTVMPAGAPPAGVSVSLDVWDFSIPARPTLKSGFDFYEFIIRKYYPRRGGETEEAWRERLDRIYRRYYLDMLAHRISPIHDVGNPSLTGVRDGKYLLDFDEFGRRVEFYSEAGQTDFGIAREARIDPDRDIWTKGWYGFTGPEAVRGVFAAYGDYLEKRGWLGRAYTYIIDESYTGVRSLTHLIHEGHPGIRNLLTQTPRDGYPDVDIWCVRINNFDSGVADKFRRRGKEIWTYVASPTRPYPTIILDGPALDVRILPWICRRFDISGLLYWCVNYWYRTDPWRDPMTWRDQNGNGSLYYPGEEGPVGSIRIEALRDGMEDYEYLRMYAGLPDAARDDIAGRAVTSTWEYTHSPAVLLSLREEMGKRLDRAKGGE